MTAPTDGCLTDRCTRPLRHRGRHTNQPNGTYATAGPTARDTSRHPADLTWRLNAQARAEKADRASRLAVGIPDFDRWPVTR